MNVLSALLCGWKTSFIKDNLKITNIYVFTLPLSCFSYILVWKDLDFLKGKLSNNVYNDKKIWKL